MFTTRRKPARAAFTLIELLTVIAIVAVLAAMLFPAFVRAREAARQTSCLSNQRQIGNAVLMYAHDYDEALVPAMRPSGLPRDDARRDYTTWPFLIQPYIENGAPKNGPGEVPLGVMKCPSFDYRNLVRAGNAAYEETDGPNSFDAYFPARYTHAHYGMGLGYQGDPSDCGAPYYHFAGSYALASPPVASIMYLSQIQRSAETVIVADGFTGVARNNRPAVMMGAESSEAHQHGANLIFLDGHARWVAGNSERYMERDNSGCWYEKYYTIDR